MAKCVECGVGLCHLDEDPNGDRGPTCARCVAEQNHDFDMEPGAVFDRAGRRRTDVEEARVGLRVVEREMDVLVERREKFVALLKEFGNE